MNWLFCVWLRRKDLDNVILRKRERSVDRLFYPGRFGESKSMMIVSSLSVATSRSSRIFGVFVDCFLLGIILHLLLGFFCLVYRES